MAKNAFEAKVITHLEYIKKKQDEHDELFKEISNRVDLVCKSHEDKFEKIDYKFDEVNKDINMAKGIAIGIGTISGAIAGFVTKFFK